jgi:hypothetical protein
MAYMNQERKQKIAPQVKKILNKYGIKGTLSVRNHSELVLTIKSGSIDFCQNWYDNWIQNHRDHESIYQPTEVPPSIDVNTYHLEQFSAQAHDCLTELMEAMNQGNWDKSDPQSDYFDRGWYVSILIGRWNKPYIVER